jgi:DNA-binding response OmpR family regulator
MKLLLIEDDGSQVEVLTKLLKRILSPEGVEIVTASTLRDGLSVASALEPDIIVLDLCLTDSPEWRDTVAHIKDFPSRAKVMIMTGLADPTFEIMGECLKAGAHGFFLKPLIGGSLASV